MLLKTLKRAGIGFLIGMAVGNFIAFILGSTSSGEVHFMAEKLIKHCGSEPLAFLMQTLLSGVIGLVAWAGMTFYELENWSMLRSMITHFLTICFIYFPCAYLLYWLVTLEEMLIMAGILAVAYIIVWLIMCAVYRAQVKQLNAMQQSIMNGQEGVTGA